MRPLILGFRVADSVSLENGLINSSLVNELYDDRGRVDHGDPEAGAALNPRRGQKGSKRKIVFDSAVTDEIRNVACENAPES